MPATVARPVALIILDGWGYREAREANAIALARTPVWHALWQLPSRTLLNASGRAVGLPTGQMGNSEVGHLNLGAGRVVMQDLVRITTAIEDGTFFTVPALVRACRLARERSTTLHLFGLLGDGGVHAHEAHLFALLDLAQREGVERVVLHALLDGRDTPPRSGLEFLRGTLAKCAGRARLASLSGRYYGMDRDNRWERTSQWYRAAVSGDGVLVRDGLAAVQDAYDRNVTDEFITPVVMANEDGTPVAPMRDGDVLLCFNFRSDRMRQALRALTSPGFTGFDIGTRPSVDVTTMTSYDDAFPFPIAFAQQSMHNLVGEVIANAGLTQLRTAETEKYPHVTFFFNGGHDKPFPGEDREMVPSPKVATYDLQPEMSAAGVCDVLCNALANRTHDFVLCNFANTDMVGHTGSLAAAIMAAETVDGCLGRILEAARVGGARLIITADHGNADVMVDPVTGQPHTAHTTNPVPLVIVDPDDEPLLRDGGALCDVGPTALRLLGLTLPVEMTGGIFATTDELQFQPQRTQGAQRTGLPSLSCRIFLETASPWPSLARAVTNKKEHKTEVTGPPHPLRPLRFKCSALRFKRTAAADVSQFRPQRTPAGAYLHCPAQPREPVMQPLMTSFPFRPAHVSRFARTVYVAIGLLTLASPARAQVGHIPANSPYEDYKPTQDLSLLFGRFGAKVDPAGVAPKPSLLMALRYDVGIGGPASLTARYTMIPSERSVIDPTQPAVKRLFTTVNTTTHMADVGLTIALTGKKTWHRLIPTLGGGVGLASNFAKADTGGYKFGTKFAFTWGAGVRYLARSGASVRLDATNYTWQYSYPDAYLVVASDTTSVLKNATQRTKWTGNWAWTLGVSYPIFR